ncbi:hypothetical protein K435DRAFT_840385 [Dendrothele bispora CBS 962.96]|uniref:Uncharacterized protein n=1 Tax=Dendrothele bispora (strain CBS 962.96) TaxID=1314807 RepID=A0A4S8LUR2_DENBC|nr:hypothetical protein K435DRAFT_840385 [Dendrothele bispora CBS 962.96]
MKPTTARSKQQQQPLLFPPSPNGGGDRSKRLPPSDPTQSTRASIRAARLLDLQREQQREDDEAMKFTKAQHHLLLSSFSSVNFEIFDLDGLSWTHSALKRGGRSRSTSTNYTPIPIPHLDPSLIPTTSLPQPPLALALLTTPIPTPTPTPTRGVPVRVTPTATPIPTSTPTSNIVPTPAVVEVGPTQHRTVGCLGISFSSTTTLPPLLPLPLRLPLLSLGGGVGGGVGVADLGPELLGIVLTLRKKKEKEKLWK